MSSNLKSKGFICGFATIILSGVSILSSAGNSLAYKTNIYAPFSPIRGLYKPLSRPFYNPLSKLCSESEIKEYSRDRNNQDTDLKMIAWMRLGACGSKSLPSLTEFYKKGKYPVYAAIFTLGQVGEEAVPILIEILKSGSNYAYAHDALLALWQIDKNSKNVFSVLARERKQIISFLLSESQMMNVVQVLQQIATEADVPALRKALKTSDRDLRCQSALTLKSLGDIAKDAVPDLIEILKYDPDNCIIDALGSIGKDAKDAVSIFIAMMDKISHNSDDINRSESSILKALGNIGKDARDAVPIIVERFAEQLKKDHVTRIDGVVGGSYIVSPDPYIIEALGNIGKDANTAVPLLKTLLQDKEDELRLRAALAIWLIQGDTPDGKESLQIAISTAINTLGQEKRLLYAAPTGFPEVYNVSADALTRIGIYAVPELIETIRSSDSTISRYYAAIILGNIGFDAKESVPILIEKLRDLNEDERVRFRVAEALGKIGLIASPELVDALKDRQISRYISYALWKMSPSPFSSIESLKVVVNDETNDLDTRRVAATTLDKLGVDMQSFFDKHNVLNPRTASCPMLHPLGNDSVYFFEFEVYSGKCVASEALPGTAAGGPSLWDEVLNWFNRK